MGPTASAGRSIRPASVSTTRSKREIAELGDVAATHQVLDALDGPAVLVGHSYGGVVITVAGNHEKVSRLVHVAAFAPGKGESVNSLIADPPRGAPVPPILPPRDGFLFLDRDQFAASFAGGHPRRPGRLHGGLPGALGRGRPQRSRVPAGLADQADLVPGRDRRPDDPPARTARHGRAGWAGPSRSPAATPATSPSPARSPI
ncbi:alpha/beta fold hydrolase [Streptomyces sp. NPDC057062]|uniref:alpha/beta fold hydrolase n=1 Tax=unclassified Streptomyces TaxID=2593676 RepID=UPI001C6EE812